MKIARLWIILVVLVAMSLACGLPAIGAKPTPTGDETGSATTEAPDAEPNSGNVGEEPTEDKGSDSGKKYDTEFPLPDDVINFMTVSDGIISFQTKMSISDALDFYKEELTKQGYTERPLLTATTDTTFSTVFDGHKSGKAIIVQAVDLGNGTINISISLQTIN